MDDSRATNRTITISCPVSNKPSQYCGHRHSLHHTRPSSRRVSSLRRTPTVLPAHGPTSAHSACVNNRDHIQPYCSDARHLLTRLHPAASRPRGSTMLLRFSCKQPTTRRRTLWQQKWRLQNDVMLSRWAMSQGLATGVTGRSPNQASRTRKYHVEYNPRETEHTESSRCPSLTQPTAFKRRVNLPALWPRQPAALPFPPHNRPQLLLVLSPARFFGLLSDWTDSVTQCRHPYRTRQQRSCRSSSSSRPCAHREYPSRT